MSEQDVTYLWTWLQGWLRLETLFFLLGPVWLCTFAAWLVSLTAAGICFSLYVGAMTVCGAAVHALIPGIAAETAAWTIGILFPIAGIADQRYVRVYSRNAYIRLRNYLSEKLNREREPIVINYRPTQLPQHI